MDVIKVEGLSKDYRQHFWTPVRRVLDKVSFEVKSGEIFGFLGPNGSGKTTTIKILFEIVYPTEGSAQLFGSPIGSKSVKKRIGFLPENSFFYDYLTSTQFLEFHGGLLGLDRSFIKRRIPRVLELVGMEGTEDLYLRNFSKGMLQRIGIAQAIIHDPDLVILDEPMTGLDPLGRKEVRDLMIELREQGKTVFFSTHILSDVESVCDRVAILNKGKLLKCGSLEDLVAVDVQYYDMVWKAVNPDLFSFFKEIGSKINKSADTVYLQVPAEKNEKLEAFENRINEMIKQGLSKGGILHSCSPKEDSLEDVFVKHVGELGTRV